MIIFFIIVTIVIFIIWKFNSELKPQGNTMHDIFVASDRENGKYTNIYKSKFGGYYYPSKTALTSDDELVFSGTETECGKWLLDNKYKQPDFMK